MSLADLTRQSVEAALAEAASIGREELLKRYGFRPARRYFVEWNGARYDSKAIAGAAHGHLRGKAPLTVDDFSGGEAASSLRTDHHHPPPGAAARCPRSPYLTGPLKKVAVTLR